jgi:hypothetical protein
MPSDPNCIIDNISAFLMNTMGTMIGEKSVVQLFGVISACRLLIL